MYNDPAVNKQTSPEELTDKYGKELSNKIVLAQEGKGDLTFTDNQQIQAKHREFKGVVWDKPELEDEAGILKEMFETDQRNEAIKRSEFMIWNPTQNKQTTYKIFEKEHNKEWADKFFDYTKKEGGVPKEFVSKFYTWYNKRKKGVASTTDAPKQIKQIKQIKRYYTKFYSDWIDSSNVMGLLNYRLPIYLILLREIVRQPYKADKLKIYDRYYQKRKLAVSIERGELCKRLYVSRKATITAQTKYLEKIGVIEIGKIHSNESYDGNWHNVYILGGHNGKNEEHYLLDKFL